MCVYMCALHVCERVSNTCVLLSVFLRSGIENLKRKKLWVSASEGYSMKKNYSYLPGRREKRGRDKKLLHLTERERGAEWIKDMRNHVSRRPPL